MSDRICYAPDEASYDQGLSKLNDMGRIRFFTKRHGWCWALNTDCLKHGEIMSSKRKCEGEGDVLGLTASCQIKRESGGQRAVVWTRAGSYARNRTLYLPIVLLVEVHHLATRRVGTRSTCILVRTPSAEHMVREDDLLHLSRAG